MFSGLGNFPDLNSTFAQLSNFSLDALQGSEGEKPGEKAESTPTVEAGVAGEVKAQNVAPPPPPPPPQPTLPEESFLDQTVVVEAEIESLREENTRLSDRAKSFEEHVQVQEKELRKMREAIALAETGHAAALRQAQEERNRINSLYEELGHKVKSQEREISALRDTNSDSTANALDEVVNSLKEENARLLEKCQAVEEKYNNAESKCQEIEAQLRDTERNHEEKLRNLHDDMSRTQSQQEEKHQHDLKKVQQELDICTKKLEKTQKRTEKEISALQSTLQELEVRAQRQQEEWRTDFATKEKETEALKQALEEEKQKWTLKVQEIEAKQQQLLQETEQRHQTALQQIQLQTNQLTEQVQASSAQSQQQGQVNDEAISALQSQLDTCKQQLEGKETALKDTIAELKLAKDTQNLTLSQLANTQEDNTKKTLQIDELTSKVSALSEKLRELMTRHSELKIKATAMAQDKESDVVKLQLKLESQREQHEELRSKYQELLDRYNVVQKLWSETQKEQQQWQDERVHMETRLNQLTQEMTEKESSISSLEIAKRRSEEDLSHLLRESERKYSLLSEEFRRLQENSGNNAEQAQALEGYKRRSQLALKKANASAATLQEENNALLMQVAAMKQEVEALKESESQQRQTLLAEKEAQYQQRTDTLTAAFAQEKAQLQEQLAALTSEINALTQKLEAQQSQSQSQDNIYHHNHTRQLSQRLDNLSNSSTNNVVVVQEDGFIPVSAATETTTNNNPNNNSHASSSSNSGNNQQHNNKQRPQPPSLAQEQELQEQDITRVLSGSAQDDYFIATPTVNTNNNNSHTNTRSSGRETSPSPFASDYTTNNTNNPSNNRTNHLHSNTQQNNHSVLSTSTSTASGFVLVDELQQQVQSLQRLVAQRNVECDESYHLLRKEKEEKEKLAQRCDELAAFLSRARKVTGTSDHLSSSSQSNSHGGSSSNSLPAAGNNSSNSGGGGVNLDYVKQVVYKFVTATEHSERQRLLPVLCALLSFTAKEKSQAMACLDQWQSSVESVIGMTATNVEVISSAFSWLGGLTSGAISGTTAVSESSSSNSSSSSKK